MPSCNTLRHMSVAVLRKLNHKRLAPEVFDVTGLLPVGGRPLKCIDPTHPPNCPHCLPAPVEGEDDLWTLRGDPGKRNGDKKLRSLVQMTKEWNSPIERGFLARHLEANPRTAHLTEIIDVIKRKETPRLSKKCMLILARGWGFKSEIWQQKCAHLMMQQESHRDQAHRHAAAVQAAANVQAGDPSVMHFGDYSVARLKAHAAHGSQIIAAPQGQGYSSDVLRSLERLEMQIIEKLMVHFKETQSYISMYLDHARNAPFAFGAPGYGQRGVTDAGGTGGDPADPNAQGASAIAKDLNDEMAKFKAHCEEVLAVMQQAVRYPLAMKEISAWTYKEECQVMDGLFSAMDNVFWQSMQVSQPACTSDRPIIPLTDTRYAPSTRTHAHASFPSTTHPPIHPPHGTTSWDRAMQKIHLLESCKSGTQCQAQRWLHKLNFAMLKLITAAKCEVANAKLQSFGEYVAVAMASVKVMFMTFIESVKSFSRLVNDQR